MSWAVLGIVWAVAGDAILLKEEASVAGRFVSLLDVIREEGLPVGTRHRLRNVYLGRAPKEGKTRTIRAEEVREELERRGIRDLEIKGVAVRVVRGSSPAALSGTPGRAAVAFEIKCRLLAARREGLSAGDFKVRVSFMEPETLPKGAAIVALRPRGETDPQRLEYDVVVEDSSKRRSSVLVIARIVRVREVAFASRILRPGQRIYRRDFEVRRMEVDGENRLVADIDQLEGARAIATIAKGAPVRILDVKLRPAIRRGTVVRLRSRYLETDARALAEGAVGETITLEYVNTRKHVRGRIVSARLVVAEEK